MPVARIGTAARRNGRPCDPLKDDEDRRNHDERFPEIPLDKDIPPPPGILLAVGVRKWNQLCEILKPKGLLSPDFYPSLENICRAYDRLVMIEGKLEEEGEVIYKSKKIGKDARGGDVWEKVPDKAHPLNREWTLLWSAIRAGLSDFGLTPASARATNIRPNPPTGQGEKPGEEVASRDRSGEDDE